MTTTDSSAKNSGDSGASPRRPVAPARNRAPLVWATVVLGLVALAQIVAASILLAPRLKNAAAAAVAAWNGRPSAEIGRMQEASITPPEIEIPPPETIGVETPTADLAQPRSAARPRARKEISPQDFILQTSLESVLVARSARKSGDMQMALDKLREAQALAPDNPEVLAEIATTFEQMGLFDKAIAHWRSVYQLGPKAGIYYRVASDKITQGVGKARGLPDDATASQQADGFLKARDTSKIIIERAESEKIDNTSGNEKNPPLTNVVLRLIFRALERPIAIRDMKVQVYFYDIINDEKIELTNADTTSEWMTRPIDWVNGALEELRVTYQQAAEEHSAGQAGENAPSQRKYLGYIVRVYYKNQLQDVAAEPKRLLDLYPPPNTLTDDLPENNPAGG